MFEHQQQCCSLKIFTIFFYILKTKVTQQIEIFFKILVKKVIDIIKTLNYQLFSYLL